MKTNHDRPILTSIFYVLGTMALVGAIFLAFESISLAITVAFAGFIYFGVGQAVEYFARTARSTERLCMVIESAVVSHLERIGSQISSATDSVPKAKIAQQPAPRSTRLETIYYFKMDGLKQGPFTVVDMQDFRNAGVVADDTLIFRDGDSDWRPLKDFPNLKS